jgi:hypothetical protein
MKLFGRRESNVAQPKHVWPALRTKPNEVLMTGEQIVVERTYDLGAVDECEQSLTFGTLKAHEAGSGYAHRIVTLANGERVATSTGVGGKYHDGWYSTKREDGSAGPGLLIRGGRLVQVVRTTRGSGHCKRIDRLRAGLDEATGDPIIEA